MQVRKRGFSAFLLLYEVFVASLLSARDSRNPAEDAQHIHNSHPECPLPNVPTDIVNCAMSQHPKVQREVLNLSASRKLMNKASQIPNPSISSRVVRDNAKANRSTELETSFNFVLELGNKLEARQALASASESEAMAQQEVVKAGIKLETVVRLHRLRQIIHEQRLFHENERAIKKLLKRLQQITKLSAEMEASQTLLELARESLLIQQSSLAEEKMEIQHFFQVATGHSLEEILGLLPKPKTPWPTVPSRLNGRINSPKVKWMEASAGKAKSQVLIEDAKAWSDIKVGPSIGYTQTDSGQSHSFGISLQMDLPLFHKNDGSRAYASAQAEAALGRIDLVEAEETHERKEQAMIYRNAVRVLEKDAKGKLLEKKYRRVQELYNRGLVSGAVLVDTLEQKISYIQAYHERELTAIKALWSIYIYDGNIFEVTL